MAYGRWTHGPSALCHQPLAISTTLLDSLVQTRRIPYSLMRDGDPGARRLDAARDISRSVHAVFQSPCPPHVCQPVSARVAQRQRAEVHAADARATERSRFVSRPAALHHTLVVGPATFLAPAARPDSDPSRDLGHRRHRLAEARPCL